MKNITQKQIADFAEVTPTFIGMFRKGKRFFSKQKARKISQNTGIGFDILAFRGGEEGYRSLVFAYQQQNGGPK